MRGETWTRLRPGTSAAVDRYGDAIPSADVETPIAGCLFAEASSDEPVAVGRAAVITTATLYTPAGADVAATDRLRAPDGRVWAVKGEPARWARAGVVVALEAVKG